MSHVNAVETAVRAAAGRLGAVDAPLVALARELARQMDAADGGPGTRLVGSYLTTIRALRGRCGEPHEAARASYRADTDAAIDAVGNLADDIAAGVVAIARLCADRLDKNPDDLVMRASWLEACRMLDLAI